MIMTLDAMKRQLKKKERMTKTLKYHWWCWRTWNKYDNADRWDNYNNNNDRDGDVITIIRRFSK